MYTDSRSTSEQKNGIENFTVLFWDDFLKLDDTILTVGQCMTELLNVPMEQLQRQRAAYVEFAELFGNQIMNSEVENTIQLVTAVQEKMARRYWWTPCQASASMRLICPVLI